MALSDDLTKINVQVENVVRKVERQYADVAGADAEILRVNDTNVEAYLRNFQWDYARYRYQGRQLSDLVTQIQTMVAKVDEELKKLSISYGEKTQALSAVQRKKTTNLITSDFEDFLTPDQINKHEFLNTEFLVTLVVIVPSAIEPDFLRTYETIGSEIAAFGGPDWTSTFNPQGLGKDDGNFGPECQRTSVKGSPVVPASAVKVHQEGDTNLYTITILKGHYVAGVIEGNEFSPGHMVDYVEPFKVAAREKRLTVREFVFDPSKAGGLDQQIDHAKWELQQVHTTIVRWCKAHYGEVYSGWVHLKVIRGFVESVLRYGLPVDFLSVFIEPNMKREKQLRTALSKAMDHLHQGIAVEEDEEDAGDDNTDLLPYVCHKFSVVGAAGISS
eukprot:CAMPEP_0182419166 /NCGR_PEP_ID=MMETSP1167-20130531/3566_1 /TAXON_ID=2988 /ORGANISM="Mallomonas Sp, Strain CCMP3275" /LENGTH=387 /DNA_ID=CAMNT_0024593831 /DNA_START=227 /DNA_END=1390 /DNA_ORIENTATION=-